jgi:hypothetical protein
MENATPAPDPFRQIIEEGRRATTELSRLIEQAVREGDDVRVLALDHVLQSVERIVSLCGAGSDGGGF